MSCQAHCCGIEKLFNEKKARKQLKKYQKKGIKGPTKILVDFLKRQELSNLSLLDIGGGIGAIQSELLKAGVSKSTDVDASPGYMKIAKENAANHQQSEQVSYVEGDFTDKHQVVASHDIVTLDKVICCYPNADALLNNSLDKSSKYYALVFPKDTFLAKFGGKTLNFLLRLINHGYQSYLHSPKWVKAEIENKGFKSIYSDTTFMWHVWVFEKN